MTGVSALIRCCDGINCHAAGLLDSFRIATYSPPLRGAIAQLGERLHGMQEVGGSIPPSSTTNPTAPATVILH